VGANAGAGRRSQSRDIRDLVAARDDAGERCRGNCYDVGVSRGGVCGVQQLGREFGAESAADGKYGVVEREQFDDEGDEDAWEGVEGGGGAEAVQAEAGYGQGDD